MSLRVINTHCARISRFILRNDVIDKEEVRIVTLHDNTSGLIGGTVTNNF